jgi:hypothetical protein
MSQVVHLPLRQRAPHRQPQGEHPLLREQRREQLVSDWLFRAVSPQTQQKMLAERGLA